MIDEIDEMDHFYRKYLEFQGESYRKVWYKLFNAAGSYKWSNVLFVTELIFYLPFSSWKDILYHESCENWSLHISEHSMISWRSMWKDFP